MAYSEFTLPRLREAFSLILEEPAHLFAHCQPVQPSDHLHTDLAENLSLALSINTEKARSELVIAPVLLEIRRQMKFQIGFFSGTEFNIAPDEGLTGFCDYILTATKDSYEVRSPVLTLVEAKNENIKAGLGQCGAEMVAAQQLNTRSGLHQPVYGCVTTGSEWKFLKLVDRTLEIDQHEYFINEVPQILGVLRSVFDAVKFPDRAPSSESK
jgi:hypothetical protein